MKYAVAIITSVALASVAIPATASAHSISKRKATAMAAQVTEQFVRNLQANPGIASVDGWASGECERRSSRPHVHRWRCYYLVAITPNDDQLECFGAIDVRFRRNSQRIVGIRRPMRCEVASGR